MADSQEAEDVQDTKKETARAKVLLRDFDDDLGDEDLLSFLDFSEEVESAITEV